MAVPSSGQLSLASIRGELTSNAYTPVINQVTHLKKASDGTISTINTNIAPNLRPDGAAPHAMSEFYGYDHEIYPYRFDPNNSEDFWKKIDFAINNRDEHKIENFFSITDHLSVQKEYNALYKKLLRNKIVIVQ